MRAFVIATAVTAIIAFAASLAPPSQAAPFGNFGGLAQMTVSPLEPAACRGPGPRCPPGRHWVCGPYGHRCWCAPC